VRRHRCLVAIPLIAPRSGGAVDRNPGGSFNARDEGGRRDVSGSWRERAARWRKAHDGFRSIRGVLMMTRARWTKEDWRLTVLLLAIFIAVGAIFGLLRHDGALIGALAGALLFGFAMGVGALADWLGRDRR